MIHMKLLHPFLCILSLVFGCSGNRQTANEVIPRETFIQLYIDFLMTGESGTPPSSDTIQSTEKKSAVDSLYAKYGVTESQVKKTMEEYSKDLQRWKDFYDEVIKRLEVTQREEQVKERS